MLNPDLDPTLVAAQAAPISPQTTPDVEEKQTPQEETAEKTQDAGLAAFLASFATRSSRKITDHTIIPLAILLVSDLRIKLLAIAMLILNAPNHHKKAEERQKQQERARVILLRSIEISQRELKKEITDKAITANVILTACLAKASRTSADLYRSIRERTAQAIEHQTIQ